MSARKNHRILLFIFAVAFSALQADPPVRSEDRPSTDASTDQPSIERRLLTLVEKHPRMKAEAERLYAALAKSRYRGWYYPDPMIGLTYMDARYRKDPGDLSPKAFMERELMISQAIPTPGRLSIESDIVDLEAKKARLRLIAAGNELTATYLRDLASAWKVHHHLDLTAQYLGRFQPILSISGAQYALGKGGLADVSMARLSLRNLEEKLQRYKKMHQATEATLTYYTAGIQADSRSGDEPGNMLHDFKQVDAYASQLLDTIRREKRSVNELSPELTLALLDTEIEEKRTTISKFEYAPDFTIFAKYIRPQAGNTEPPEKLADNRISLGFTMRVPLWSAMNNHNNVEEGNRLQSASRFSHEDLSRAAEAGRSSLLFEIDSATERLVLFRTRMIPEANRAVLAAREGYQSGSADFNSLLRVWETLYALEMEAIELETERLQKIFELARLLNLIQPRNEVLK